MGLFDIFQNTYVFEKLKDKPIPPLGSIKGWKQHPIDTSSEKFNEKLVAFGSFSGYPEVFHDSTYFGQHKESSPYDLMGLSGALLTPFLRESVAQKIAAINNRLPDGYGLMIWDAYRTLDVQKSLFEYRVSKILTEEHPDWTREQAEVEAQKLVSLPSPDPTKPSTHNTGGSVDLTIVKFTPEAAEELKILRKELAVAKAREHDSDDEYLIEMNIIDLFRRSCAPLNMGVVFDENSPRTFMRYYEELAEKSGMENLSPEDREALENRRILSHIMLDAGFTIYEEEAWHFDSGNQFNAIKTGSPAVYSTATLSSENLAFENMRVKHFLGTLKMQETLKTPFVVSSGKLGAAGSTITGDQKLALEAAAKTSKVTKIVNHPQAQKL